LRGGKKPGVNYQKRRRNRSDKGREVSSLPVLRKEGGGGKEIDSAWKKKGKKDSTACRHFPGEKGKKGGAPIPWRKK